MTTYDRGDIVLLSYPINDALEMHLRPAMVIYDVHPSDAGIAIVPISPEPSERFLTMHLPQGSFEAARFGLMGAGYLTASDEVIVERAFVVRTIGRCPWQTLNEFIGMMRQPIVPKAKLRVRERTVAAEGFVREAV
ncbi:MAG: hypothetical protein U5J83_17045 [Bryobacterales bacterium]|nr:hypothetical protein [Bryobacterales bacterium]